MDRHWYHRLLYGAVKHGQMIENKVKDEYPEIALTDSIGKESPLTFLGREIHSTQKIDGFYFSILTVLVASSFFLISTKLFIAWVVVSLVCAIILFANLKRAKS
jgi:hypothetical protein